MPTEGHNGPPPETAGPFAIYRHDKLKTERAVRGRAAHMMRTIPTPNADPARRNRVLIGTDDPAADLLALIPAKGAKDANGKWLRRGNSTLAIEVMLTASPEWWQEATREQKRKWLDSSIEWLSAEYGRERIAHLTLHLDETSPHLTGFIAPTDPTTGRLNARLWIGGADRCREQQTAYAEAVEHLGLRRGIEGSKAEHQSVRRFYAAMNAPEPSPERGRAFDIERTARKASEAQAQADRGRADRTAAALNAQKALTARMRALDLGAVLDALGFEKDADTPHQWKHGPKGDRTHRVNIDGAKWFDLVAGKGRGGAIDLAQHVLGTDFKGALAWLSDRFGEAPAAADLTASYERQARQVVAQAVQERPPFTPPPATPANWQDVRAYLTTERAIPANIVDELHERGDVYADDRKNAVFVCRDDAGTITGAEKKGRRFAGMAPGSKKDLGGFRLGKVLTAARVYLVESALDAISLWVLHRARGERGFAVVSAAGSRATVPPFLAARDPATLINAFDADAPGDKAAKAMDLQRERPTRKDWNDDLKAETKSGGGSFLRRVLALGAEDQPTPTEAPGPDLPSPS